MTKQVDAFAKAAADAFGLSETMAKKYVGTLGAMSKSFGYSESAAYDMATALTGLTGDVASFYNLSQEEAYTKLKSVFTGETESLKELGVVMTQSALDQMGLVEGLITSLGDFISGGLKYWYNHRNGAKRPFRGGRGSMEAYFQYRQGIMGCFKGGCTEHI